MLIARPYVSMLGVLFMGGGVQREARGVKYRYIALNDVLLSEAPRGAHILPHFFFAIFVPPRNKYYGRFRYCSPAARLLCSILQ